MLSYEASAFIFFGGREMGGIPPRLLWWLALGRPVLLTRRACARDVRSASGNFLGPNRRWGARQGWPDRWGAAVGEPLATAIYL